MIPNPALHGARPLSGYVQFWHVLNVMLSTLQQIARHQIAKAIYIKP